jgi:hypothetical protein
VSGEQHLIVNLQLSVFSCFTCTTRFAVEDDLVDTLKAQGKEVMCPAGHPTRCSSSERDDLARRAETAERNLKWHSERCDRHREEEARLARRISSLRGLVTRMKRAGRGKARA